MAFSNNKTGSAFFLTAIIVNALILILAAPTNSYALGNDNKTYTLLEPLPCIESVDKDGKIVTPCPSSSPGSVSLLTDVPLSDFFQYAFNLLIALAAVAAVFMIVWGGFEYITTDSWQGKKGGKDKFLNAIYGLGLVLIAYIVLKTINPKLVEFPASIPPPYTPQQLQDLESPLSIFDKLNADIYKYSIQGQADIDSAKNAKETVQDLQNKKTEKQNEYNKTTDADLKKKLQLEIAAMDEQIKNTTANQIVQTAKSIFENGAIGQTSTSFTKRIANNNLSYSDIDNEVSSAHKLINQTQATRDKELSQIGAYTQIALVDDAANSAGIIVELIGLQTKIDHAVVSRNYVWVDSEPALKGKPSTPENVRAYLQSSLNTIKQGVGDIVDQQVKADIQRRITDAQNSLVKFK